MWALAIIWELAFAKYDPDLHFIISPKRYNKQWFVPGSKHDLIPVNYRIV